nr:MAG TPA: hypothetical protein [Caudoviricetes sp.]
MWRGNGCMESKMKSDILKKLQRKMQSGLASR